MVRLHYRKKIADSLALLPEYPILATFGNSTGRFALYVDGHARTVSNYPKNLFRAFRSKYYGGATVWIENVITGQVKYTIRIGYRSVMRDGHWGISNGKLVKMA